MRLRLLCEVAVRCADSEDADDPEDDDELAESVFGIAYADSYRRWSSMRARVGWDMRRVNIEPHP